jgi:hypothetical protein
VEAKILALPFELDTLRNLDVYARAWRSVASLQKNLYSQMAESTALKETNKTLSSDNAELRQRLEKG